MWGLRTSLVEVIRIELLLKYMSRAMRGTYKGGLGLNTHVSNVSEGRQSH